MCRKEKVAILLSGTGILCVILHFVFHITVYGCLAIAALVIVLLNLPIKSSKEITQTKACDSISEQQLDLLPALPRIGLIQEDTIETDLENVSEESPEPIPVEHDNVKAQARVPSQNAKDTSDQNSIKEEEKDIVKANEINSLESADNKGITVDNQTEMLTSLIQSLQAEKYTLKIELERLVSNAERHFSAELEEPAHSSNEIDSFFLAKLEALSKSMNYDLEQVKEKYQAPLQMLEGRLRWQSERQQELSDSAILSAQTNHLDNFYNNHQLGENTVVGLSPEDVHLLQTAGVAKASDLVSLNLELLPLEDRKKRALENWASYISFQAKIGMPRNNGLKQAVPYTELHSRLKNEQIRLHTEFSSECNRIKQLYTIAIAKTKELHQAARAYSTLEINEHPLRSPEVDHESLEIISIRLAEIDEQLSQMEAQLSKPWSI